MANVPNQWSSIPENPASWIPTGAATSSWNVSASVANQFTSVNGLTRYSLYNDPLVGYSQVFPYNGAFIPIGSQYQSGSVATSSWSSV